MRPENINRGGPKKWVPSAIREADKDKRIAELEAELRGCNDDATSIGNDERHFPLERAGARMVGAMIRERLTKLGL